MQSFRRQEHALIYTIPALALTFVFFVVPLGYLIVVSLFKWNGLGPMEFTGLGNYEYIFRNANFHKAFRVTLLWLASALIVHIPFGLLLSLMLNRRPHGWKFLRVMYFIPNVISTTAVAFYVVLYSRLAEYLVAMRRDHPELFYRDGRREGNPLDYGCWGWGDPQRELSSYEHVTGHAVRAMYLYCGMADVARETGDTVMAEHCDRLFHDVTDSQMYITGGHRHNRCAGSLYLSL